MATRVGGFFFSPKLTLDFGHVHNLPVPVYKFKILLKAYSRRIYVLYCIKKIIRNILVTVRIHFLCHYSFPMPGVYGQTCMCTNLVYRIHVGNFDPQVTRMTTRKMLV